MTRFRHSTFALIASVALLPCMAVVAATTPAATPVPAPAATPTAQLTHPGTTAQAFDYALLKGQARWLASNAYQPPKNTLPDSLAKLSYDQYQNIRSRADHALWADDLLEFRIQFFHTGRSFSESVRMYEVQNGQAREITYDPAMFDYDRSGLEPQSLRGIGGFAGFRIQSTTNWKADISAFLGAAIFAPSATPASTACQRAASPWTRR